jgi:hypothetical protein
MCEENKSTLTTTSRNITILSLDSARVRPWFVVLWQTKGTRTMEQDRIRLEPGDRVLWTHPTPDAKSLVETRLSGRLHINSQILVAGARYENYMQIEIEPFPLVA